MRLMITLILYILLIDIGGCISQSFRCNLVQKSHDRIDGVGVFAGRNFAEGEVIERSVTVVIPTSQVRSSILQNYVFYHLEDFSDIVFGYAMVYNHNENANVLITTGNSSHRSTARSLDFVIRAKRDIYYGEELYSYYGENWFDNRDIPFVEEAPRQLADVHIGASHGCPSMYTEIVGGRVYATQSLPEGIVIEVARALVIPAWHTRGNDLEAYAWFAENSDYGAMIMLGNGALYRGSQDTEANVVYDWHTDETSPGDEGTVVCTQSMLVAFRTMRRVEVNEELIIPLITSTMSEKRRVYDSILTGNCI